MKYAAELFENKLKRRKTKAEMDTSTVSDNTKSNND